MKIFSDPSTDKVTAGFFILPSHPAEIAVLKPEVAEMKDFAVCFVTVKGCGEETFEDGDSKKSSQHQFLLKECQTCLKISSHSPWRWYSWQTDPTPTSMCITNSKETYFLRSFVCLEYVCREKTTSKHLIYNKLSWMLLFAAGSVLSAAPAMGINQTCFKEECTPIP